MGVLSSEGIGRGRQPELNEEESSELCLLMHFQDRDLKCENCDDFLAGVCPGGKKTELEIRECLSAKGGDFYFGGSW